MKTKLIKKEISCWDCGIKHHYHKSETSAQNCINYFKNIDTSKMYVRRANGNLNPDKQVFFPEQTGSDKGILVSNRVANALHSASVYYVNQIKELVSSGGFIKLPNVGKVSLHKLLKALGEYEKAIS